MGLSNYIHKDIIKFILSDYIHKDIIKFILRDYIDYYELDFYQKIITNLYKNLKRYVVSNKSDKSGRELRTYIDIHLRKIERWFPSGIKRSEINFL
jgi:hypothetical protein